MKNVAIALSTLAFAGVVVLFVLYFSNNKSMTSHTHSSAVPVGGTGRIAYVNIDTLEANYEYLKAQKDAFNKRQESMKAELQNSASQMEKAIAAVRRKAEAGTLTEAEYRAEERRIGQMQQSLQTREAALTEQLLKEQEDFNKDLQTRLDSFLADYNKDAHYDYILSYSKGGHILYASKQLDITTDIIEGMNKRDKVADTSKNGKK